MSSWINGNLQGNLSIGQGERGKSIEYEWRGTELGIRREGEEEYQFVDLAGSGSGSGREIELQVGNGYIQWRYKEEEEWNNLISIDSLKGGKGDKGEQGLQGLPGKDGADGKSLEFNWNGTELGVKQEGQLSYSYVNLKGQDGRDGVDGNDGTNGKDGVTPNLQVGTVTTLEAGQQATVIKRGTTENPIFDFAIPQGQRGNDGADGITPDMTEFKNQINEQYANIEKKLDDHIENCSSGSGFGEKLIVRYVHQGNKEIYFSNIDYDTGIATTTEPHGITSKTEIMIVPNNWTLENYKNNVMSIPIEYTRNNDKITVTRVSDTELKITKNNGETLIPVNKEDISNENIDCTKFHFEIPIPFSIDNMEASNYIRLVYIGYVKSAGTYRYTNFNFIGGDDNIYNSPFYINHLGLPKINNAASTHCVFAHLNQIWDFRHPDCVIYNNSTASGRRLGYSSLVWDAGNETDIMNYQSNRQIKGIKSISTYANMKDYAYLSNNSVIYIYDLGGLT